MLSTSTNTSTKLLGYIHVCIMFPTMPTLESASPEQLLAATVHRLLDWLSGAPAGLKLNQPLTQALSAFFSYHVHLWILYLGKT
ncbi:Phosphatidylinositol N-acetylglucosaminyltransferase subunit Q [Portunus trituberculatus]|uniref:Phosphatidylinositol N-acetylglucosaminyltransferase subunit Q n=1 Tax=Portunus trituberculatus TaxID=210409 RepID=A0A5B7IME5_PORTR|nr:Phosphatidylinositol N-acetylglucosaminyltransferase subunit Q [Portunus trituberculatus]